MFRTVTANPILALQSSHVCMAQESVSQDKKTVDRRYVILDSHTLQAKVYTTKDELNAAVDAMIEAARKDQPGGKSAADMLAEAEQ